MQTMFAATGEYTKNKRPYQLLLSHRSNQLGCYLYGFSSCYKNLNPSEFAEQCLWRNHQRASLIKH